MTQQTTTTAQQTETPNILAMLRTFAHQKPRLNAADYGGGREGWNAYRRESAEITRDLHDFQEMYILAVDRIGYERANIALYEKMKNSGDRLTFNAEKNRLEYCTGQYFPTEYRPAACRVLSQIIWANFMNEKQADGQPVYKTGHDIRKAIARRVSRRIINYYFN